MSVPRSHLWNGVVSTQRCPGAPSLAVHPSIPDVRCPSFGQFPSKQAVPLQPDAPTQSCSSFGTISAGRHAGIYTKKRICTHQLSTLVCVCVHPWTKGFPPPLFPRLSTNFFNQAGGRGISSRGLCQRSSTLDDQENVPAP